MRYAPLQKLIPSSSTPCTATASNAARAFERSSGTCEAPPSSVPQIDFSYYPCVGPFARPPIHLQRALHTLEGKADLFCFFRADGYFLRRGPELFVPRLDGVRTGRQIAQIKAAVLASHGEVGVLEHGDVSAHPRMHVALHRDGNFLACEGVFHLGAGWLRLIPLAVIRRHRMDVMRSGIVVHQLQLLISAHSHHVRLVHAALLFDDNRLARRIKLLIS